MERINLPKARKAFINNQTVWLNPCKMRFDPHRQQNSFLTAITIHKSQLDEATPEAEGFDKIVNEFIYYNCTSETGRYPHFYIES